MLREFPVAAVGRRKKTAQPPPSPPAETRYPLSKARTLRRDDQSSFPRNDNRSPCTPLCRARAPAGCAQRIAARSERVRLRPHVLASHCSRQPDNNSIPSPWPQCCTANLRECCQPQARSEHLCNPENSGRPIAEVRGYRQATRTCQRVKFFLQTYPLISPQLSLLPCSLRGS